MEPELSELEKMEQDTFEEDDSTEIPPPGPRCAPFFLRERVRERLTSPACDSGACGRLAPDAAWRRRNGEG